MGEGFEGIWVGASVGIAVVWGGPVDGILENRLDIGVVVDGEGFVAGSEVEDTAVATGPCAPGAEDLSTFEPGEEDQLIRFGNIETFAIHFRFRDFQILVDTLGDGMIGGDVPKAFFFATSAPLERAGSTHKGFEDFGVVGGVKGDESHTLENVFLDACDHLVANFIVGFVAPPEEHVCMREALFCQTMIGIVVECCCRDFQTGIGGKGIGKVAMNAKGVEF